MVKSCEIDKKVEDIIRFEKELLDMHYRKETEEIMGIVDQSQIYFGGGIYFVRYSKEIIDRFRMIGLSEGYAFIVAVYKGRKFISIPFQNTKFFKEVFSDKLENTRMLS